MFDAKDARDRQAPGVHFYEWVKHAAQEWTRIHLLPAIVRRGRRDPGGGLPRVVFAGFQPRGWRTQMDFLWYAKDAQALAACEAIQAWRIGARLAWCRACRLGFLRPPRIPGVWCPVCRALPVRVRQKIQQLPAAPEWPRYTAQQEAVRDAYRARFGGESVHRLSINAHELGP
jgi:hypothetical protein